jgi:hypothetical protein
MTPRAAFRIFWIPVVLSSLVLAACSPSTAPGVQTPTIPTPTPIPEWFTHALTDVRTGEGFTINDFAGKVVLIQAMAQWCPNCIFQQAETREMITLLDNPEDLVVISLDVDLHEDEASLKQYTQDFGFEWRFAVAPVEVLRALGNLYSAEYLNPPVDPMLLIDRQGDAHQLDYGLKKAGELQETIAPYLDQ